MSDVREHPPVSGWRADSNVRRRHPAEAATWIWAPGCAQGETAFLRFSLKFAMRDAARVRLHVSADQRYQLYLDGAEIGFGPDRGEVEAWPVATYEVDLATGGHQLEALVWWLRDDVSNGLRNDPAVPGTVPSVRPPVAQSSWRGGFLLAGEGLSETNINTGIAPWRVENLTTAVRLTPPAFRVYHDIGPEFHLDGARWTVPPPALPAAVVAGSIPGNPHGVQRPGWRLQPSGLPEQLRARVQSGRVRALHGRCGDGPMEETLFDEREAADWRELISGRGEVTIPADSERTLLWDFEAYVCAYARLSTLGGAGATVRIDWAESLHEVDRSGVSAKTPKGRRDAIAGKVFSGFGDTYRANGDRLAFPAFWWRSGRYLRVQVRTGGSALTITSLAVVSTGYPFGDATGFRCDDSELEQLGARSEVTLRACGHEVWVDCPYYEQAAYVGDSRLAALNNYALFADDRLSRRMVELFDESRRSTGLVAERIPSAWTQVSTTYSLLWILMVRDFAWWRDDTSFVRARLRGVRAMLDEVLAFTETDGLLRDVPGWAFVDWVPGWAEGCGPGVREGDSSIVNLHLLLALRTHAELEQNFGEPELAALAERRASCLENGIRERYWCKRRGLLADESSRTHFSEHAQALGFLTGLDPVGGRDAWIDAWLEASDLPRATLYFSFYTLEALRLAGRERELHERLEVWRKILPTGLLTLPEMPEPTRSDCHGWGAHLRWHLAASIAGVRPTTPGFARVEVAPLPGHLRRIETNVRHPRGMISVALSRDGEALGGEITLPEGTAGELRWRGRTQVLRPGRNAVDVVVEPSAEGHAESTLSRSR